MAGRGAPWIPAFVALLLIAVPPLSFLRTEEGRVTRVADGDTLTLATREGTRFPVRLYGIDAPETRHKGTPGQPYGEEARRLLKSLVLGRTVTVDIVDVDTHGRVVGIVRREGVDINREMVRSGLAWAYRRFLSGPYVSGYIDAEKDARSRRLGLWNHANPEPPWKFKERIRSGDGMPPSPVTGVPGGQSKEKH